MARLRFNNTIRLSEDSTEDTQIFDRDLEQDEVTDQYAVGSSRGPASIPPSTSLTVNLAGLANVQYLFIESDKAITCSLNGGTAFNITPRTGPLASGIAPVLKGKLSLMTDGLTSLVLANASVADTAKVTIVLAGS